MSELSVRIEPLQLAGSPTSSSGQIDTPNQQAAGAGGTDPLDQVQRAAKIGEPVPIVFGKRRDTSGGVMISPPATEARFSNDVTNAVTASYLLVLSEGRIDPIQVRDVFQQSCRVGSFTQAYNRRAGTWGPGNFITAQPGFEDQIPEAPIFCGTATGTYAGMTTGSFTNTIPHPFTQWDRQVHMFSRGGMWVDRLLEGSEGPSDNVVDLFLWLLRRSSRVPEALIDHAGLTAAARFVNANGLYCNTIVDEPSNLADWISQTLPYFLLRESRSAGKKGLRPMLPANADGTINTGPVGWRFTFTEDHILPGAVEIRYSSRVDRRPFCAQMIWRQQPDDAGALARTAELRYGGSAIDGPFEQHDLSGFATTEDHAFKAGAYIIASRRYVDHRLTITARPALIPATLAPGDIVRVRLRRVASVGANEIHDYLYEIDTVARGAAGGVTFQLTHMPVDDQGRSLVALDVSRAQGNGLLLPTGRAPVSCDLNSIGDTSFETDFGPWSGWDFSTYGFDPPLYGFDTSWPDGVIDLGDGWGPGIIEDVSTDFTDEGWGSVPDPDSGGWTDLAGLGGTGGDLGLGYTAAVSFSTPLVVYPDVFYAVLSSNFASVEVTVTVSNPPTDGTLTLQLADGSVNDYNPEAGSYGGGNVYTVKIPEGETQATITVNTFGDSPSTATSREFRVIGWSGGGYIESVDPETEIVTPALETSATAPFTVAVYVGSISLQQPGIWTHNGTGWEWAGPEDTGDWTWSVANQEWDYTPAEPNVDWTWLVETQNWTAGNTATWAWNVGAQRWVRSTVDPTAAGTKPEDPPDGPPSPPPDEITPAGKTYTVVAQASVNPPAIPNGANNLELDLLDFYIDEADPTNNSSVSVGTLEIEAISMLFGAWRWNPGASWWEYPSPPTGWRWHPGLASWQWIGADSDLWSWNQNDSKWFYANQGNWEWDGLAWAWTAGGTPEGDPPDATPPGSDPPTQNGSNHPPDAERWTYSSGWSGTAQWPGGTAPDFTGLLSGTLTYHMA